MKPPPFAYAAPGSLDEALELLAAHGDEAKVLAGGQSLVPLLNMRLARPAVLVDVNRISELAEWRVQNGTVSLGATVRQSALTEPELAAHLPLAAACAPCIGHFVTRNRGTVGGSVAHADARGELPLALLALDGTAVAASKRAGTRSVGADELFVTHFTTSLAADELLVETRWPARRAGWRYAFEEFAQRHGDYALAMVAVALRVDGGRVAEARIAVGGTADRPLLLESVAASVTGSGIDDATATAAGEIASSAVEPTDDLHASSVYRRRLVATLVARACLSAYASAA
ncbi:MAG: FAD binding domain-containing protein [Gaiellales bacterium]